MSNGRPGQARLLVPHRYRVRQAMSPAITNTEDEDTTSTYSFATRGSWTRGSYSSSFIDGELGSTLGRWMRAAGRVVIDPLDNILGTRELKRLDKYLDDLDHYDWHTLKDRFDAESYAPRLVEVLRYGVYPQSLRLQAQRITLKLAIFGKIRFDQVKPRIHFHTKDEFEESVSDFCATALSLVPKQKLLDYIPADDEDTDGFLWSLRQKVSSAEDTWTWSHDDDDIIFNLAVHSYKRGRWSEAAELFLNLTEGRWHLRDNDRFRTLACIHWLAETYSNQGRLEESEQLHTYGIQETLRLNNEGYDGMTRSNFRLVMADFDRKQLEDPEKRQLAELEKRRESQGEEHPDTLSSLSDLAEIYGGQGRWKEAEEIGVTVLQTRKRLLGEEHHDTIVSMTQLAVAYKNQDRLKEAEELEIQVLRLKKRVLAEEYSPIQLFMLASGLAKTYRMQGRHDEADLLQMAPAYCHLTPPPSPSFDVVSRSINQSLMRYKAHLEHLLR